MTTTSDMRASGILAHISSLPSPHGIGDIGDSASAFLDFLHDAGQGLWQFLPTGPTDPIFDNSPYMGSSAFAGSPLLISVDILVRQGLLEKDSLMTPDFSEYQTSFKEVSSYKKRCLEQAFLCFADRAENPAFQQFKKLTTWLSDYCLFMALKEKFQGQGWFSWPEDLAKRLPTALLEMAATLKPRMEFFAFEQFTFFSQWQEFHHKAQDLGIDLVGDIPLYVAWDSVDVWANQDIFDLDPKTHAPTEVAGVPPDYFSKTGQRWGNPLYRWNTPSKRVKKQLYTWWTSRFAAILEMVDIARVDHFRGFESYWAIPAKHSTAVKGKWRKGPGLQFFKKIYKNLGPLPLIAEDLGEITPEVIALRDALDLPGMKVLQFAFDGNRDNCFLPFNFETPNSVVYTGTHDNDTTVGWFLSEQLSDTRRRDLMNYCNHSLDDAPSIHKDLIYLALSSISRYAIFPLQDILGFGNDCKMNRPGSKEGNWTWRCAPRFLGPDIALWLHEQCRLFGRCPKKSSTPPPLPPTTPNA